jgi:hypothetical protein
MNAITQPVTKSVTPPPPQLRYCKECGEGFYPRRDDQDFHNRTCRQKWHARRQKRGMELIDFALEWRGKRLKGGFTKFCQMVDEWLREDRAHAKANKAKRTKAK